VLGELIGGHGFEVEFEPIEFDTSEFWRTGFGAVFFTGVPAASEEDDIVIG